jgi:DNA-directed RNA polymerase subunit M/transcription elongation factor TFIIS
MHFCTNCSNMYYIRINSDDTNKLVYYCRKCGNEDKLLAIENVCVSRTLIKKSEQSFNHIINKYTKLDPTLPRINNVLCPNADCKTNTEGVEREIIYIRYDDTNMKYVYLCSQCDTVWNVTDKAWSQYTMSIYNAFIYENKIT